jgi:hypothetical protein
MVSNNNRRFFFLCLILDNSFGIILEPFKGATLGTRAASFLIGFGGLAPKKWRATAIRFKTVD